MILSSFSGSTIRRSLKTTAVITTTTRYSTNKRNIFIALHLLNKTSTTKAHNYNPTTTSLRMNTCLDQLTSSVCCASSGSGTSTSSKKELSTMSSKGASSSVLNDFTNRPAQCVLVPPGECQFNDTPKSVKLLEKAKVNHNTSLFRFECPNPNEPLKLSTCACLLAEAEIEVKDEEKDGEEKKSKRTEDVIRPYTPISTNAQIGSFDLLVKHYENGKMSQYLNYMNVGDMLSFKHIKFNVKIQAPFEDANHICMIVGGTGITPMIQALHAILGDDENKSKKVTMLYGSKSVDDILGKPLLDSWVEKYPDQLEVVHVLSDEPKDSDWDGHRGFISKELVEEKFSKPSDGSKVMIFICGPPPLYNVFSGPRDSKELDGILKDVGYNSSQVFKF